MNQGVISAQKLAGNYNVTLQHIFKVTVAERLQIAASIHKYHTHTYKRRVRVEPRLNRQLEKLQEKNLLGLKPSSIYMDPRRDICNGGHGILFACEYADSSCWRVLLICCITGLCNESLCQQHSNKLCSNWDHCLLNFGLRSPRITSSLC